MKKILLLFLPLLSGCSISRFVNRDCYIDLMPPSISADSVIVVNPAFSMWYYEKNLSYSIEQRGRPDSFVKLLNHKFSSRNLINVLRMDLNSGCMQNKMSENNWEIRKAYDYDTHKCLPLVKDHYNVFFNVGMSIKDAEMDVSGREFESVDCYVIVIKNSKVLYYRHFASAREVKKHHFPKGSKDREDFPYFANNQIERVVKSITADLIKRIVPASK